MKRTYQYFWGDTPESRGVLQNNWPHLFKKSKVEKKVQKVEVEKDKDRLGLIWI